MGYLPKHIKVQHQKRMLRVIANAALAGAVIVKVPTVSATDPVEQYGSTTYRSKTFSYLVRYDDGQVSHFYNSRGEAATRYLLWWFQKNQMWPRYQ